MDSDALVTECQTLVVLLDQTPFRPMVAMLVKIEESDSWRFWIVPPKRTRKEDFFLELSKIFSANREKFGELDIGTIEFKPISDRMIELYGMMFRFNGIGKSHLQKITVNGILLPETIAFRIEM